MIYREQVKLNLRVQIGTNDRGNPIYENRVIEARAAISPLDTRLEAMSGTPQVVSSTRYRVILEPGVDLPANGGGAVTVDLMGLTKVAIAGSIERHTVGGRLHHYEFTTNVIA